MSRAFTKEDDAGEDLPEQPIPAGPNYMTPRGLELMREKARALADRRKKEAAVGGDLRPIDRDLRYLEARVNSAIIVPPGSGSEIRFGATVTTEDTAGQKQTFQIVGEDEARTGPQFLAWSAPLVFAMLGSKAGDTVTWDGPDGAQTYKILKVEY